MDSTDGSWILASKWDAGWDAGMAVYLFIRMLVSSLPDWVKITLFTLVAGGAVWSAVQRLRQRRAAAS
ncbi:hypothetical protein [Streptomyces bambusae]|uniref:Uncharacterized protein n=1 Tax=Streptomyces bambusae TaxID=1550616 RepID=A0ABS6Z2V8_9ACTN|nr:hypothetical protein [Streptomyces bambusae]MBW5482069.1 hypothetical protein [Streptomyces bambusae]